MSKKNITTVLTKEYFDTQMSIRFGIQDAKIDKKFAEQDVKIDQKFAEQDVKIDKKFKDQDRKMDRRFTQQDTHINKRFNAIQEAIDFKLDPILKEQEENKKFRTQVMQTLDWLVGAFKKFEDEHSVLSGKYSDIHNRLDNHEERINTLEQAIITQ